MSLIVNKGNFTKGLLLMVSFIVIFVVMMMRLPMYGTNHDGQPANGLDAADNLFNALSKGSSYFIPETKAKASKLAGVNFEATVKAKDAAMAGDAVKVYSAMGLTAEDKGEGKVALKGDLGKMLVGVIEDADAMYKNDDKSVGARYGIDGKKAVKAQHATLENLVKELQKQGGPMIENASTVNTVVKRTVEPGFNFFGIQAEQVSAKLGIMLFLLVFYVVYTMWYGFAIFDMFDGIGLSMKKAKVKKEV